MPRSQQETDAIVKEVLKEVDAEWASGCTCERCGFHWKPKVADPRQCPSCKSHHWKFKARRAGRPYEHTTCAICDQSVPVMVFKHHARIHDHQFAIQSLQARIDQILLKKWPGVRNAAEKN